MIGLLGVVVGVVVVVVGVVVVMPVGNTNNAVHGAGPSVVRRLTHKRDGEIKFVVTVTVDDTRAMDAPVCDSSSDRSTSMPVSGSR